ncbi:hypothetical protein K2173_025151 [Erythroxylum novogranatense]|uniref:FHA domain-containing protein n=1 Tax=Erythroxylum novogranatense TaxID=1862640 RepID=A0AAV8SWP9_9ROSI|nr:hypothetical protein K2173_025151 [Erythroxylum novogranatense]
MSVDEDQKENSVHNSPVSPRDFIVSVAFKISSQPLSNSDPDVWGVLTAISTNARKRHQGINMLLTEDEHCIGRLVEDIRFQVESTAVSATHCKIFRRTHGEDHPSAFLKDTSTNGTYLNWKKLGKNSPEIKIRHGDIISFAAPPQHELAFAFVYREVPGSTPSTNGVVGKRKPEEILTENKRLKGIGIGSAEGPISLDDFRSLQRSNKELRKQLESQVVTIDKLRSEHRATIDYHKKETEDIKESMAKSYTDQVKELEHRLGIKQEELDEANSKLSDQKHALEDLNERLSASRQSCMEGNQVVKSQKAAIAELEAQLEEERDQRRDERHKAATDLKAAVQRVQEEFQEELKRMSHAALQRETELQEEINKLQEREKKWCSQVETLRPKLEETRQKLVISDNKVRQLEAQICEGQRSSANGKKRVEELEQELKRLRKDLHEEKQAAREEAWAKVSALELEINAAMRDLEFERRRLKGARERIMLRETQLRAFYSTTEEISVLFAKQQDQLKSMRRTLEDEENYENTSADIDLDEPNGNINVTRAKDREIIRYMGNNGPKADYNQALNSSDELSVTEKHECDDIKSQGDQNIQGEECTSNVKGGCSSKIEAVGTAPVLEADAIGTERVLETESPGIDGERNVNLNRGCLAGDTMQLDEETDVHECGEHIPRDASCHSQSNNAVENQQVGEDTEPGSTIRTADLLASEVVGSWAYSTAPSVHGDNGSPRSRDNDGRGIVVVHDSGQVAESQSAPFSAVAATRRNREYQALSEMIGIVAPDLKEKFGSSAVDGGYQGREKQESSSNSDTESCTGSDDRLRENGNVVLVSDAETGDSDEHGEQNRDYDDEATEAGSLG